MLTYIGKYIYTNKLALSDGITTGNYYNFGPHSLHYVPMCGCNPVCSFTNLPSTEPEGYK